MFTYSYEKKTKENIKFLLIYDITLTRRRTKFAKLMEGYGKRVQKSAFECCITKAKYKKLLGEITKHIRKEDSVRIYPIHFKVDVVSFNEKDEERAVDVLIC